MRKLTKKEVDRLETLMYEARERYLEDFIVSEWILDVDLDEYNDLYSRYWETQE